MSLCSRERQHLVYMTVFFFLMYDKGMQSTMGMDMSLAVKRGLCSGFRGDRVLQNRFYHAEREDRYYT